MSPRLLIYAKADRNARTTEEFEYSVLEPLYPLQVVVAGDIRVYVQTSFYCQMLRLRNGNDVDEVPLPKKYQRFALSNLNKLSELVETRFQYQSDDDMATSTELANFLDWAVPGQSLGACDTLNLWGHGSASSILHRLPFNLLRWRNIFGETYRKRAYLGVLQKGSAESKVLQPKELATVLRYGHHQPGLIALTSCRVSSLEFAYDLAGLGDFLVASTTTVEPDDWPYAEWLSLASENERCGKKFGTHVLHQLAAKQPTGKFALIDLAKTASCKATIDAFIDWALGNIDQAIWGAISDARKGLDEYCYAQGDTIAVDLGAFFHEFANNAKIPYAGIALAEAVSASLNAAVVAKIPTKLPSIEAGISLIFPRNRKDFDAIDAVANGRYDSKRLNDAGSTYIKDSKWLNFLGQFWRKTNI